MPALAGLALSPLCAAHETIPPDWCSEGHSKPKIVAEFEFDGPELRGVMEKCGIVEKDDGWHTSLDTMIEYCKIVDPKQAARPIILGPSSFVHKEHHSLYDIDSGIRGVCAVCPGRPE
ncbi:MAG: hypothetical protein ACREP7_19065 [Lysobacter sp.]